MKLLALWAAERLGKFGEVGETNDIVATDVASSKPDVAIGRVVTDLRSIGVSQHEVRRAMNRFLVQADETLCGRVS